MEDPHGPRVPSTAPATTLQPTTLVREAASGKSLSVREWVDRRMREEGRDYEAALEEAVNAVGRGDLTIL